MTPREALHKARTSGFDENLQAVIVASGDAELAYSFACNFEAADLEALEPLIVAGGIARIVYDFALIKSERGGDISSLQCVILESNDPGLAVLFAADVVGADIEAIQIFLNNFDSKYSHLLEYELSLRRGFF